jgi:WD40 repeat protein
LKLTLQDLLASCSEDKTIKVWDLNEEKTIQTITHHKDKVASVCWHPEESNILLSASYDGTISLFDPSKSSKFNSYKISKDVESLKWNPHQKQQFCASLEDGTVVMYDYRNTKSAVGSFKPHPGTCSDISFHPLESHVFATCSAEESIISFWDISSSTPKLLDKKNLNANVFSIDFIENILAAGGKDGKLEVYPNISFKK